MKIIKISFILELHLLINISQILLRESNLKCYFSNEKKKRNKRTIYGIKCSFNICVLIK